MPFGLLEVGFLESHGERYVMATTIKSIKASLDELKTEYPAGADKAELQTLLVEAEGARAEAEELTEEVTVTVTPLKEPGEITRMLLTDDGEKHICTVFRKIREDRDSIESFEAEGYKEMIQTLQKYLKDERVRIG